MLNVRQNSKFILCGCHLPNLNIFCHLHVKTPRKILMVKDKVTLGKRRTHDNFEGRLSNIYLCE